MKVNYNNEQIKRQFYEYLENSRGFSPLTIRKFEQSIWLWEDFTNKADYSRFNKNSAGDFKNWLKNRKKAKSTKSFSLSYCYDILRTLKIFFEWLSQQQGYKSKINQTNIDYLNLTRKENLEATQSKSVICPTLEEVKKAIENIKGENEVEMRDKALFSLTLLTGARVSAIRTLPMKSFDRNILVLYQDPQLGVATKFGKKIVSSLMPFSYKEALVYFLQWYDYLEKKKEFKPDDPIFPATKIENTNNNVSYFSTGKIEPRRLKNSNSLRSIFRKRFGESGIKYYHPHTFRHLLVKEIAKLPLTEEEKKAISQNLGHANVTTTFGSYGYGRITEDRQVEIIRNIDFGGRKRELRYSLTEEELKQIIEQTLKTKNPD
jgi:site-specific recombinase XerD